MKIERYGKRGFAANNGNSLTFELLSASDKFTIDDEKEKFSKLFRVGEYFTHGEYTVAAYGDDNNLPVELREVIKKNHLLPEILKKQVRFLYGQGPFLYDTEIANEKMVKKPLPRNAFKQVWKWLESWQRNGIIEDYKTYLKRVLLEYYYTEGVFSKWVFNKSRRTNGPLPVRGLEYMPSQRCRLAMPGLISYNDYLEDHDFTHIMYSRWDKPYRINAEVFPRLNMANPLKHNVAINYARDFGFGEELYSYPTFYYGLRDWIIGSNLDAKYINSYLKNSLSAKIHVVIPDIWLRQKESKLQEICQINISRGQNQQALIEKYEGVTIVKDVNGIKTALPFDYWMIQKIVDTKIEELLNVMTGEGDNQGKTFISRSFRTEHGLEEWEFKEIPVKYKEFVDAILSYDKRAVEVILQGKGVPPSISSVSNEGIFQTSGSDTYYNYLIYLASQNYAEEYATMDINNALHINFPELRVENIRLGFYRHIPERQEEVQPDNRLTNTAN